MSTYSASRWDLYKNFKNSWYLIKNIPKTTNMFRIIYTVYIYTDASLFVATFIVWTR